MRIHYFILFVILFACKQTPKAEKETKEKIAVEEAVELIESAVNTNKNTTTDNTNISSTFEEIIKDLPIRDLPFIDTTNFDNYIEEEDYLILDFDALKLYQVYNNYNQEEYGFKAVKAYRVAISDDLYSLVVTVKKGDHELETVFINYDLDGKIIAHQVIAFDEIAEGWIRKEARITENRLIVNELLSTSNGDQISEIHYSLQYDGLIGKNESKILNKTIPQYETVKQILAQLELNFLQVKTDLLYAEIVPNNNQETIVVIPEIHSEGDQYFELNSYIVIANNQNGIITHKYYEDYKTNGWGSDAVKLYELTIDTAPYQLNKKDRAFGIRAYYVGSSLMNPYENQNLSLFVKDGKTLRKILHNYDVMEFLGELDEPCNKKSNRFDKTLIMSDNKTNDYFDILIKDKHTYFVDYLDEDGDCDVKETISNFTSVLKFDGKTYEETDDDKKL